MDCSSESSCTGHCSGPMSVGGWDSMFLDSPARQPRSAVKSSNISSQQPAGLLWFTQGYQPRRTEWGWKQMGKRERVCLCFYFYFYFIFLPGPAFWEKREEEPCSELVSCQASSPVLLVQVLHRLCREYNSNFWKHTEQSGPFQRQ